MDAEDDPQGNSGDWGREDHGEGRVTEVAQRRDAWLPFYLGSDPELTFKDKNTGRFVPAHELGVPSRHEKKEDLLGSGKFFRDGWNLELNPNKTTCRALHYKSFSNLVQGVNVDLPAHIAMVSIPAYRVKKKDRENAPADVAEFGCSPARGAYVGGRADKPRINAATHPMRYAGGHMHFSTSFYGFWGEQMERQLQKEVSLLNPSTYPILVRWLDLKVGLPASWLFSRTSQYLRRRHYGRAGEYRDQQYDKKTLGLEYRVLGPEVFNSQGLYSLFSGLCIGVLLKSWKVEDIPMWEDSWDVPLQEAINTGKGQEELLNTLPWESPGLLTKEILREFKTKMGDKLWELDVQKRGDNWGWAEFSQELGIKGVVLEHAAVKRHGNTSVHTMVTL